MFKKLGSNFLTELKRSRGNFVLFCFSMMLLISTVVLSLRNIENSTTVYTIIVTFVTAILSTLISALISAKNTEKEIESQKVENQKKIEFQRQQELRDQYPYKMRIINKLRFNLEKIMIYDKTDLIVVNPLRNEVLDEFVSTSPEISVELYELCYKVQQSSEETIKFIVGNYTQISKPSDWKLNGIGQPIDTPVFLSEDAYKSEAYLELKKDYQTILKLLNDYESKLKNQYKELNL